MRLRISLPGRAIPAGGRQLLKNRGRRYISKFEPQNIAFEKAFMPKA
jgi:hypothetical protein